MYDNPIAEGRYKVHVNNVTTGYTTTGIKRLTFKLTITEGDYTGETLYWHVPMSPNSIRFAGMLLKTFCGCRKFFQTADQVDEFVTMYYETGKLAIPAGSHVIEYSRTSDGFDRFELPQG